MQKGRRSHIEELLHQQSVGVQVSPGQATEVCVVQVEKVLRCTGRGAALAVLHHTQPQCTSLAGQQTICNIHTHKVMNNFYSTDNKEEQHLLTLTHVWTQDCCVPTHLWICGAVCRWVECTGQPDILLHSYPSPARGNTWGYWDKETPIFTLFPSYSLPWKALNYSLCVSRRISVKTSGCMGDFIVTWLTYSSEVNIWCFLFSLISVVLVVYFV